MDPFATKGIEYLLVFSYLFCLVPFWLFLRWIAQQQQPVLAVAKSTLRAAGNLRSWFEVPEGFHFHRGHTWAQPEKDGLLRVGVDDFAQQLIGAPSALRLPAVGDQLTQGEKGWQLQVKDHEVDLLSPLNGEVVAVNEAAIRDPELVCQDPYGNGWLIKVRAASPQTALKNLLPGKLARSWMDETVSQLNGLMHGELGPVLQDGGVPVSGFARQLAGEHWPEIAAEFLLTEMESIEQAGKDGAAPVVTSQVTIPTA
jgi:glycine cleavage system H lipoate-binding protein